MNDKKSAPKGTDVSLIAEREEVKSRKFKYGTLALIVSVIFIVAVVFVNVLLGYLTDRFVLEVDMTKEKLFEISENTKEVIADLSEPITITVLAEETTYQNGQDLLANIYEVLQRYVALGNGKITVRYLDPLINVGEVDRYREKLGVTLTTNDLIVESSKRIKRLAPQNLYTAQVDNYNGPQQSTLNGTTYYVGLRAEQRLSSALLYVTSDEVSRAAWLYGHSEQYGITEMETLLNYANYEVIILQLMKEEIPDDVALLIISDPQKDYTTDEIKKIDAFLARGGDMIIAMGPEGMNHPNLDLLFEQWGVKYGRNIIYDTEQCFSGYPSYVIPNTSEFEGITANLPRLYPMIPAGRPIEVTGTQQSMTTVTPLMGSSATSYAKRYEDAMVGYGKSPDDPVGPFFMSILSERGVADKAQVYTRTSIFFTNAGLITQTALTQDAFLNRTYIGAVLNYISDNTDGLVIPDKEFTSTLLTITGTQTRIVFVSIVLILPALIILAGIIVWVKRKHL
ncbi:MAG: GldG family protein [Oscillospiraceae bacterium]|jgi:hypothetical protein|nr:GldG family protein [Oscillospiraceae bacterium]